ncbi:MAG TPA: hypothetical protein VF345_02045 [Chthoniobacterales bacterium]
MKRLLAGLPLFFAMANLFAQRVTSASTPTPAGTPNAAAEAAAATAIAGIFGVWSVCCVVYVLLIVTAVAAWLYTAIWIMHDAKSRQSENAQLVTVLGWIPLTWVIGLIVHLATRPKVNLVVCPNCKKKRIEGSAVCPHCGKA